MMDLYTIGTFLFGCCCALYCDIIDYKKHKTHNIRKQDYDLFNTIGMLLKAIIAGYVMMYFFELFVIIYPIHLFIRYLIYDQRYL
jgi:hypothetical protein